MSILIKGIDMPKEISSNCIDTIMLIIDSDGLVYDVNRNKISDKAVEISEPHGRLIDADAELKKLSEMNVEGESFTTAVNFAKLCFEHASTVVEAESKDND